MKQSIQHTIYQAVKGSDLWETGNKWGELYDSISLLSGESPGCRSPWVQKTELWLELEGKV